MVQQSFVNRGSQTEDRRQTTEDERQETEVRIQDARKQTKRWIPNYGAGGAIVLLISQKDYELFNKI